MDASEDNLPGIRSLLDPRVVKLNLLLLLIPAAVVLESRGDHGPSFLASMGAIMPLAWHMGKATEEIAMRTNESVGGLLNATFGNAVEMIIAALALWAIYQDPTVKDTMLLVVQASLIGSILGNLLLVLGMAFLWGGLHHATQKFTAQTNGSLLLLALVGLVVPMVYASTGDHPNVVQLSHYTALLLLLVYGLQLLFQLRTHADLYAAEGQHDEVPVLSQRDAMGLLLVATLLVAWMAEILVGSIGHAAGEYGLPTLFIGIILVPVFGNAAEHFTAITVAGKNKMDLSVGIAIGSSIQIALFVAPAMVLLGWALGVPLTLEFGIFETVATFLAVLVTNFIIQDGESNWLEGAMLLVTYGILALAFFFL
ncbi:MAG: calcium/proton exchanger [Methanobacteriota archaeon]|nr:MAG: calcium/proton exchanger [Euryarchaeota archaeon]